MLSSGDSLLIKLLFLLGPALAILAVTGVYSWFLINRYTKAISRLYEMNFNSLETERKRIANDIHDILGNKMIQINSALSNAEKEADEKTLREIRSIRSHFSLFNSDIGRSIEFLYPRDLIIGEWESSLRRLITSVSSENLQVSINFHTDFNPSAEQCLHLYRLVQEKLSNISKHANCDKVHIDVAEENTKYYIALIYKGQYPALGWKKNWLRKANGRGLHVIQDRLNILKADNDITECEGNVIDEISFEYENTTS